MNTNEENEVKQTININVPDIYHNGIDDNFGKGKVIANTLKKTVKDITNASFVKILKFYNIHVVFFLLHNCIFLLQRFKGPTSYEQNSR